MNTSLSWIKTYVPDLDVTAQEYTLFGHGGGLLSLIINIIQSFALAGVSI